MRFWNGGSGAGRGGGGLVSAVLQRVESMPAGLMTPSPSVVSRGRLSSTPRLISMAWLTSRSLVLTLLLTLGSGCSGDETQRPKVLLVGLDGADWQLLDELMAAGAMPNLAKLKATSSWGVLRTEKPPLSPLLWTTMVTGVSPAEHGVLVAVGLPLRGIGGPRDAAVVGEPSLVGLQLAFQALAIPANGSPGLGEATGLYIL